MTIRGYLRVSSKSQEENTSLENQREILKKEGCTVFYPDVYTGVKSSRPQLDKLLSDLEEGDQVVVTKMDRIARSAKGGLEIIDTILEKKATIKILNMGTFDNSATSKLQKTMLLAFAEFEHDLIVDRLNEGKARAKEKDENFREGRKKKYTPQQLDHALSLLGEYSYKKVSELTGISVSTLTRAHKKIPPEKY